MKEKEDKREKERPERRANNLKYKVRLNFSNLYFNLNLPAVANGSSCLVFDAAVLVAAVDDMTTPHKPSAGGSGSTSTFFQKERDRLIKEIADVCAEISCSGSIKG
jgi:hypothetical protein